MNHHNIGTEAKKNEPLFSKQMRVAGILDELSERFFSWDCVLTNLNYHRWREQIIQLQPDILFVESIWNGDKKSWRKKLTPFVDKEFIALIHWCKQRKIPTFFWNKEDPIHMPTFLHIAHYFDIVLTTDFDCIPLYRRLLKHDRVYVLPFACSPRLFNPIEKHERKKAICFAGTYYRKARERTRDFEHIITSLKDSWPIDIYDRNPYPDDPDYAYPKPYQKYIRGTLPLDKIDIAYKSYVFAITLNIVKYSSTMQGRRVFELLSSNTFILSNPCQGLKNLLGNLVLFSSGSFEGRLLQLSRDDLLYRKMCLAGLRKALLEHTYENRMDFIYYLAYNKKPKSTWPEIILYSDVESQEQLDHVLNTFKRQNYEKKQMIVFIDDNMVITPPFPKMDGVFIMPQKNKKFDLFLSADYCGYFSPLHYYGKNYLTDLVLATRYSVVSAIGKGCFYAYRNSEFILEHPPLRYQMVTSLQKDRSILPVTKAQGLDWLALSEKEALKNIPCMSTDAFNFCQHWQGSDCSLVDDLPIDTGMSIERLYKIALSSNYRNPKQYYTLQWCIYGQELKDLFSLKLMYDKDEIAVDNKQNHGVLIYAKPGSTQKKAVLDYSFDAKEYSNNFTALNVFIDAAVLPKGDCDFYCFYYDKRHKPIGSYFLHAFGITSLPVQKEGFAYFKIGFIGREVFSVNIRELIINPKPKNNLDLLKMEEECFG